MSSNIHQALKSTEVNSSIQVTLTNNATVSGSLYLLDLHSNAVILVSQVTDSTITDLRLISISAIKEVSNATLTGQDARKLPLATQVAASTPKKSGSSTPAGRGSRPETPQNLLAAKSLVGDAKLLMEGLSKHLRVRAINDAIVISLPPPTRSAPSLQNTIEEIKEVTLLPPYTKIEGQGEQIDKVRRILESERGVITPFSTAANKKKKNQRKEVKVPAKGG